MATGVAEAVDTLEHAQRMPALSRASAATTAVMSWSALTGSSIVEHVVGVLRAVAGEEALEVLARRPLLFAIVRFAPVARRRAVIGYFTPA